jgi:hypothetical protein
MSGGRLVEKAQPRESSHAGIILVALRQARQRQRLAICAFGKLALGTHSDAKDLHEDVNVSRWFSLQYEVQSVTSVLSVEYCCGLRNSDCQCGPGRGDSALVRRRNVELINDHGETHTGIRGTRGVQLKWMWARLLEVLVPGGN